MSKHNIARILIGVIWGLIINSIFSQIGKTPDIEPFTILDSVAVIAFVILLAFLSVATFAAAIDDN